MAKEASDYRESEGIQEYERSSGNQVYEEGVKDYGTKSSEFTKEIQDLIGLSNPSQRSHG